jgi:hypothetical protein
MIPTQYGDTEIIAGAERTPSEALRGDPALAHTRRPVDNDPGSIRSQDGGLDSCRLLRAAN